VDEPTGPDRSRVGVMSLPRELFLDASGALASRPARELDRARRELVVSQPVNGRGSAGVALSARSGQGVPDVEIRVTAGGVYGRLDVEVSGAPKEQASLAVWTCGDAEG
jgi:hypothetical protein